MQELFEEIFFALIGLALVLNAWYLLFKFVIYIFKTYGLGSQDRIDGNLRRWFNQAGNSVRATTWVIAVVAVSIVWLAAQGGVLNELRTEITGIAITVILIDELVIYRNRLERKQELIEQLYSRIPDASVEALRLIRKEKGWWDELDKTAFNGVQWAGADLRSVNLAQSLFLNANLEKADFKGAVLIQTDFGGASLEGADFWRANLTEAQLGEANLAHSTLTGAILKGAKLCIANLEGAILQGANLSDANLQEANLPKTNLKDAILVGANLEDTNLANAQLWRVNLASSNLGGADLRGADFWSANLEEAQLRYAKYNSSTRWPRGFDPKKAGAIEVE